MKNAIELIRVSTEGQAADDRASIPAQRAVNKRTALQFGLTIVRSIELSDVSGTAVLRAPEIQEMLRLIESPEIHAVVTKEFTRLMRPENLADFAMLQAFIDSDTILYLPDGPIDFRSEGGFLLGGIRALMAGVERKQILGRVWDAKEEKRRRGENPQSAICLPRGVTWSREAGWLYTAQSEAIKEAFERVLSGDHNYAKLAELVGVTPRGMHVILRNPIYSGWRVIDKKRDLSPKARLLSPNGRQGDRRKMQRADEDVIRVRVFDKPLISEEQFATVQRFMDSKQLQHWRSDEHYEHRFAYAGFLTCSECGDRLYTFYRRDDYYICKSRRTNGPCVTKYMRRDRIEPTLDLLFGAKLTNRKFLRDLARHWQNQQGKPDESRDRAATKMRALDGRRERTKELFIDGALGRREYQARVATMDAEEKTLRMALAKAPVAPDIDTLVEAFKVFENYDMQHPQRKRQILAALGSKVHVANYQIAGISINCCTSESHTAAGFVPTAGKLFIPVEMRA